MTRRLPLLALAAFALTPAACAHANAHTTSRWAYANERRSVRTHPSGNAAEVAPIHFRTEDGRPEVYSILRAERVDGRVWLKIRIPGRPNGRRGWVPREALGNVHTVTTFLRVDLHRLRATLYDGGRSIWSSPVGVGKPSTPTPAGRFYIRERIRNLGGGGLYGPWAFGTSAYSVLSDWPGGGVVGIHGTDQPDLIPGRPSHGCVRVPNDAMARLARLMPIGTPVEIR
jgi:hypothetical protein